MGIYLVHDCGQVLISTYQKKVWERYKETTTVCPKCKKPIDFSKAKAVELFTNRSGRVDSREVKVEDLKDLSVELS